MALQNSNAPKAKFGSPVKHAAPLQSTAPAHRSGYLIIDGVLLITSALTPATKALE